MARHQLHDRLTELGLADGAAWSQQHRGIEVIGAIAAPFQEAQLARAEHNRVESSNRTSRWCSRVGTGSNESLQRLNQRRQHRGVEDHFDGNLSADGPAQPIGHPGRLERIAPELEEVVGRVEALESQQRAPNRDDQLLDGGVSCDIDGFVALRCLLQEGRDHVDVEGNSSFQVGGRDQKNGFVGP